MSMRASWFTSKINSFTKDIRLFFLYAALSNICIGAFSMLYNLYLVQLRFQEDFIGIVNAVATGSLALSALLLGRLLDRFGAWWCLTYGTAFYLIASLAVTFAESPWAIVTTVVFQGMATTFLFVPLMPFVIDHSPAAQRQTVAAIALSLTSLSATIGSLLAGWTPWALERTIGLPAPSVLSYRLALLLGIALCSFSLLPLLAMRTARLRRTQVTSTLPVLGHEAGQQPKVRRYLVAFVVAGGVLAIGNGAVVPFLNVYLATLGLSTRAIGIVFAAASLLGALCGLFAPIAARHLGPLRAVTVIRLVPVLFFALLLVWQTVPLAVLAILMRAISISMAWPIDSTLIADLLPSKDRANAFGFRSAAWNIGFASASFVAGQAIVRFGYAPALATYVLFCSLAVAYTALRLRDHPAAHGSRSLAAARRDTGERPSAGQLGLDVVDDQTRDFEAGRGGR